MALEVFALIFLSLLSSPNIENIGEIVNSKGPPVTAGLHEKQISPEKVSGLSSTDPVRSVARNYGGVVLESESVTYDEDYGYIYRYDVDTAVEDVPNKSTVSRGKVVISTVDDKRIYLSFHSLFDLP